MKTLNPHALFDTLIAHENVYSDADIAKELKIAAPSISKTRNGKQEVTDTMRVAIMRRFKWSLKRIDDLAPPLSAMTE